MLSRDRQESAATSVPRAKRTKGPDNVGPSAIRLDLGCGDGKQPGFIGLDRFVLPGVDVVCDLNSGIPLATGKVDYVVASHSLEHLRDLPTAIAEIFRVCRDRAQVTIIAPYDATHLNRANPYHLQNWNEHTARFFTDHDASAVDTKDYRFPAIKDWGLQASDHTRSDVDLRCLRMEFSYFPPYRALDEQTKRTLRHSLSDVCDQIVLHLLVVKSPISPAELAERSENMQDFFPPAFEARRREETEVGTENLFSELARVPARLSALASKSNDETTSLGKEVAALGKEIVALGNEHTALCGEMRRFIERVDHLDRALVAEKDETARLLRELAETGRSLSERMTAINSALTRQIQSSGTELQGSLSAQLRRTLGAEISSKTDEVRDALAEHVRAQVADLGTTSIEPILAHLVAERRGRMDFAFRPIRFLRRYRQRGLDLRTVVGGELARLWAGPEAPAQGFKLQLGTFFVPGQTRTYVLQAEAGVPLRGIELGASAIFPHSELTTAADFELCDAQHKPLRSGLMKLDETCRGRPVAIDFEPLAVDTGQPLVLKMTPNAVVDRIGIQLLEWHRVGRLLRRVSEQRLAYRALY